MTYLGIKIMNRNLVSSGNTLMDLRLMILRTISKVWKDPALRDEIESKSPLQIYDYFAKEFNYHTPFDNFGIKFIKPTAVWNFYGDNQWSKPEDETITLTIPRKEPTDNFDNTERLFEFYSYFPTFFGLMKKSGGRSQAKVSTNNPSSEIANFAQESTVMPNTDFHGNDYDLGVSEDSFLGFGGVVLKLIAAAWENPELMNMIDYNNQQNNSNIASDAAYYANIKSMLNKYYDFEFPWAFNLKFVLPTEDESFWFKKNGEWIWRQYDNNGRQLIRNTVTLEIPHAPKNGEKNESALALARYNMIGPAYPFTCS